MGNRNILYNLDGPDAVTEIPLVPDAGVQGEAALAGFLQAAPVRLADLGDSGHLIGFPPQLGGEGDLVSGVQGMDFPEVIVGPAVMGSETDVAPQMEVSSKCPAPLARVELPVPS